MQIRFKGYSKSLNFFFQVELFFLELHNLQCIYTWMLKFFYNECIKLTVLFIKFFQVSFQCHQDSPSV